MKRWLIWLAYNALWTTLLVLPGSTFTPVGPDDLPELRRFIFKTGHVLAYAVFAWLSGWVRAPARYRWLLLFFVMAHGTATELIQLKVSNRSGTLEDVGLDNLGVLLGLAVGWKWWSDPK